jgi:uncharacterized protein YkwD
LWPKENVKSAVTPAVSVTPEVSELDQINVVRTKAGKASVVRDSRLDEAALLKANYIVKTNKYTHSINGEDSYRFLWPILNKSTPPGTHYVAGENLAWCGKTIKSRVDWWVNSPKHYEAMIGDYDLWGSATAYNPVDKCNITVNYFVRIY